MMLHYAAVVGEHERVIDYWILKEDWIRAIAALSGQVRL